MSSIKGWPRRDFFALRESIGGTFAVTTTNFLELNIKRGQQFYINEKAIGIPADGGVKEYMFRIGPNPIILKSRIIKTQAIDIDYEVRVGGDLVFTDDGTPITIQNANGVTPNANESVGFEDPTYTGNGFLNELDWIPGTEGVGNRSAGSFSILGFEKIIPANSEILTRFTNNGTVTATIFYFLTWYEGEIKPIGDEVLISTN